MAETIDAVKLFPLRVKDDKKITAKAATGDEVNRYDPADHEATIPIGDNAYERTIRLHESLHAIYSHGRRVPRTIVGQAAEDLRLHLNKSKLTSSPRRDEVASAIKDLRSIAGLSRYAKSSWRMEAMADDLLGVFLRSVAILSGRAGWSPSDSRGRFNKLIKAAYKNTPCNHKAKLGQSLKAAFDSITTTDSITNACATLHKHFKEPDQERGPSYSSRFGEGINNPLIRREEAEAEEFWEGFGDGEFNRISYKNLKFIPDDKIKKRMLEFKRDGLIPAVRMHRLALTHPKRSTEGPVMVSAFSGARIRAKRIAAAMTSPVPIRLFERKRIKTRGGVGGTILIDASGSMGISDKTLEQLLTLCPMGSIAYYDAQAEGNDQASAQAGGDIVVIAERGRQCDLAASKKHRPPRHGANLIDLQAMQWMLTQPKPWWYLTDGQFTGACSGIAHDLLKQLLARKQVKQVVSHKEMIEILQELNKELEAQNE